MSKLPPDSLTCVVPTYNRPHYLRRLLTYWSNYPLAGNVLIADSSETKSRSENEHLVKQFAPRLPLRYQHFDQDLFPKCVAAMETIDSPYVVFCADDDFLVPEAVDESLQFLQQNPEYACAQGMMVSVVSFRNNRCDMIRGFDVVHSSPTHRFRQMAKYWYSTFYAVYPISVLQECFRIAARGPEYHLARIYPELMMSQVTMLLGKAKFFPRTYNIRQDHRRNDSRKLPRVQDLANGEQYYQQFRQLLVDQIQQSVKMTEEKAGALIDTYYNPLKQGNMVHPGLPKIRREIHRAFRQLLGRFRRDSVMERCRLSSKHPTWQDRAWQLAYRLILDYPEGMTEQDFTTEQRLAGRRALRAA